MKRFLVLSVFTVIALMSIGINASAQSMEYKFIQSYEGVSVYWRYRQELKDQYISELKFVNNNNYKVDVSFKPHFICADNSDFTEGATTITIVAGGNKAGQWSGLFYYPCGGKQPPKSGGYKNMKVIKAE